MSTPHAFASAGRVLTGAALLSAVLVLSACKGGGSDAQAKAADEAQPPVPVETEQVTRRSVAASWVGTAALEVPRGADVVAKTSGIALDVLVEEGDQVRAGQPLVRLDPDRARLAAEQAVVCPLLDGVDLSGAKGVLVNITADDSLRLGETREAMNAIRAYASPDANIIFGTVNDPTMGDSLRVTVLATGLCGKAEKAAPELTIIRTGTDNVPLMGQGYGMPTGADTHQIPAIWRSGRGAPSAHVNALMQSGMEEMEIPAFLRKQAD